MELDLVPLVSRAMPKGMPRRLCAQEDFKQPVCLWMGLCSCPVGCLAWGIPALEPAACWMGPDLGKKVVASRRAHTNKCSQNCCYQSFLPQWITATPHLCKRSSNTCDVTALFPVFWYPQDRVCTLQEWSFFPPPHCGIPAIKPCRPSKPDSLGVLPAARPPGWGIWCGTQNFHSYRRTSVI